MARKPSGATMLLSLFRTSEAIERVARKSTSGIGMCHSDFVLLQDLLHAGAQTPGAIGAKVGLTSGSVTAALDRLEHRGFITREPNPDDQRSRIVALTEAGRAFIVPAYQAHARDLERVFADALTQEERAGLFELLGRVRRSAREDSK